LVDFLIQSGQAPAFPFLDLSSPALMNATSNFCKKQLNDTADNKWEAPAEQEAKLMAMKVKSSKLEMSKKQKTVSLQGVGKEKSKKGKAGA